MAVKKNNYITAELDFAEMQLASWKRYIEENPYEKVVDRKDLKRSKTGGSYEDVIQNKESIQKSLRDTLKEYIALLDVVNKLREVEENKQKTVKGGDNRPFRMDSNKK